MSSSKCPFHGGQSFCGCVACARDQKGCRKITRPNQRSHSAIWLKKIWLADCLQYIFIRFTDLPDISYQVYQMYKSIIIHRNPEKKSRTIHTIVRYSIFTLPETNIAPENGWLEYEFPFGARPIFRGYSLVSGRVYVYWP